MKILENCCGKPKTDAVKIPSDETAKKQAEFLKAISDPARIRIIYALRDGELCVCEIMELLKMPQTMVSHHCKILKVAGIVSDRKFGKWVNYSLADKRVLGMLETLFTEG
jgi:ArsR family transcriptional regulator, lead/cadmium/zinc/bismuth-responsive transcriptional repressor